MRCSVVLRREGAGVEATCAEVPACRGRGASAEAALRSLREALEFQLELCPCDVTTGPGLVLEVVRDETAG